MDIQERHQLVKIIETTFANVPYPTEINDIGIIDFRPFHWRDLPIDVIFRHRDSLTRLADEAFRFYLPAILRAVVLHPLEVDTLTSNIIYDLSPAFYNDKWETFFEKRVEVFTTNEKQVIAQFIVVYKDLEPDGYWTLLDDAKRCLDSATEFWSQFLS